MWLMASVEVVEAASNASSRQLDYTLIIVALTAAAGSIITAFMTKSSKKANASDHGFVRDAIETLMSTHVDILHKIEAVDVKVDTVAQHVQAVDDKVGHLDGRLDDVGDKVGVLSVQFTGHLQSDLDKALNDKENP